MSTRIIELAAAAYEWLLPLAWSAFGVLIAVLLPLSAFRGLRKWTGEAINWSSYVFGLTTWFLGATVTLSTWGWVALLIGLIFFGVGVVPIGILAAFIGLKNPALGFSLIVMSIITYGARWLGTFIRISGYARQDEAEYTIHEDDQIEEEHWKVD